MTFKTWATEKKIKESDLIFTKALKNENHLDLFERAADLLATFNPTFSEALPVLEWQTDLVLMGHREALFEKSEDFSEYRNYLKALRYPQTSTRDADLKTMMESLPWPYGSKVKFERRGDRAGVELRLFVSSAVDLTKIMASLERVQKELS